MPAPVVFISYTHDSPEHCDHVLRLSERLRSDGMDAWIDQYEKTAPAQGWPQWMGDQIAAADFVLVVCTRGYHQERGKGSDWEWKLITQEIYEARSQTEKFVSVALSEGQEQYIPRFLRGRAFIELTSESAYEELRALLSGTSGVEPSLLGELLLPARRRVAPLRFEVPQRLAPSRLHRHAPARLFGRENDIAFLDAAWTCPRTRVLTLVAWGGVGKTALVSKWAANLAARNLDGADYFDWSFYSEGRREGVSASADAFIAAALRHFGPDESPDGSLSPWDRGARLARLVGERRTLLLLDGLEPLQHPPGPLSGELKDPAIASLLAGLAARNSGLCVVTTRVRVKDLAVFEGATVEQKDLASLTTASGSELLEALGVHGTKAEIAALVDHVGGHALTLNLLGNFLKHAYDGDVRIGPHVLIGDADAEIRNGHAFRVIEAYEGWFAGEGEQGARLLGAIRLLGLFDRPAIRELLVVLRQAPVISGLTDTIVGLSEAQWNLTLSRLAECGLLSLSNGQVDTHPLVREYFGHQLRTRRREAWQAAHGRLFDHLRRTTAYRPDSIEGLQPLYQAVAHGCQAGRAEEARRRVFGERILRFEENFSTFRLGAVSADLSALACFFDSPWVHVSTSLSKKAQAWVLNEVAFRLVALGRLSEAVDPMRAGLAAAVRLRHWNSAARYASNLSELDLALGNIHSAIRDAETSVNYADRSHSSFHRMARRTTLAEALHQSGRRSEAQALFEEAERMQVDRQPRHPWLYSLRGHQYSELLLTPVERAAAGGFGAECCFEILWQVESRTVQTLEWVTAAGRDILSAALDHLTLARVKLYRALLERSSPGVARADADSALSGLRRAGMQQYIPKGLLTRAWVLAALGDPESAREDLTVAAVIAERGPMPLIQADVALHRARLLGDRPALAIARFLIERHGYWRRREELQDLESAELGWKDRLQSNSSVVG